MNSKAVFNHRNNSSILTKAVSQSAHLSKSIVLPRIITHDQNSYLQQTVQNYQLLHEEQLHKFSKKLIPTQLINKPNLSVFIQELNAKSSSIEGMTKIIQEYKLFPEFKNNYQILEKVCETLSIQRIEKGQIMRQISSESSRILKASGQFFILEQTTLEEQVDNMRAEEQCLIFSICKKFYEKLKEEYLVFETLKRMLAKSAFFYKYPQRHIQKLVFSLNHQTYTHNQTIFEKGQPIEVYDAQSVKHKMYFILEGQVEVRNKVNNEKKPLCVCTLSDGEIFGEEALNQKQQKRFYGVAVKSKWLRVIQLNRKQIVDWLKRLGLTLQIYLNEINYLNRMKKKRAHYARVLKQLGQTNKSVLQKDIGCKLDSKKRGLFEMNLKKIQNIDKKMTNLQRVQHKRIQANRSIHFIDFESPLFARKDFPSLVSELRRFQKQQTHAKKMLEQSCIR